MEKLPGRWWVGAMLAITALIPARGEFPVWAYPVNPAPVAGVAKPPDEESPLHVPDSPLAHTRAQIAAIGGTVPDWHPEEHPPLPGIVGRSREPKVYACGYCHLPTGAGRPENTSLAGLTPAYLRQQMAAFRQGDRPGSEPRRVPQSVMIAIAQQVTEAEVEEAVAYFSRLQPKSWVRVVEAEIVPRTVIAGWTWTLAPDGGSEPIGQRIVEMPEDFARFEKRDSRTTYVAYVPPGSIAHGAALVTTGKGGQVQPCAVCHGPDLKGLADVPRLAGRSPSYLMRQLYDLKVGTRKGGTVELMKPVVAGLSSEDMVAIVAYVASLPP